MRIAIPVYEDISILDEKDEILFKVERKFKWNSKKVLGFYKGKDLILKTSNYTLLPFFSEKIHFQNIETAIDIRKEKGKELLFFDESFLKIKHKPSYLLTKNLCDVLLNDKLIANVKIQSRLVLKTLILNVKFTQVLPKQIKELALFFIVIKYADIDGD